MKITEFEERLKGHAKITKSIISPPFDLKKEINKLEGKNMIKNQNITWIKRVTKIAAVLTICAITAVSAVSINGSFKDVKRFDGAIIGTEYINATNEIKMNALRNDENIVLDISYENPNKAPFTVIQEIAVTEYKILDKNNKEVLKFNKNIENAEKGIVENGKALIKLPMDNEKLQSNEEYKIMLNNIWGLAKAEQPLKIMGNWNIEISK